MRFRFHPPSLAWILAALCALGFLAWVTAERVRRVDQVTQTDSEEALVDAASATGYAGGKRWLIVPEHNQRSYQGVAETQQMLATGEWRIRHIDYDNAPFGREVSASSPYRWWLGFIAWCDHTLSGRPLGLSVERAALFAGPVLHLLMVLATTIFVARIFGALSAALLALGLVAIYPFAGGFLPGVPDDPGLGWMFSIWCVLLLLAGVGAQESLSEPKGANAANQSTQPRRRSTSFLLASGVAGGLGLWISPVVLAPVLVGISGGGVVAAFLRRSDQRDKPVDVSEITPWRTWSLAGATTCIAAYLIEYFPAHLAFQLRANHPLYGLAWIGLGELLAQLETGIGHGAESSRAGGTRHWNRIRLGLALAVVAGVSFVLVKDGALTWLTGDLAATRLSYLPNGVVAKNYFAWLKRDGVTGAVVATTLPLLLLAPGLWLALRRTTPARTRAAIAFAGGPVLVVLALAGSRLSWWGLCDGLLLMLMTASIATANSPRARWGWSGLAAVIFAPGLLQLMPPRTSGENIEFTRLEVEGLVERAIAHWISDRAAGGDQTVILTPPARTTSWCFHGGMRGVGSTNWENRAGLEATIRITNSTTADEALGLLNAREIRYIVLPSWDTDLDEFARWSLQNPEDAFVMALHHWALPPWLRPIPYKLPAIAEFENQSVAILEVTGESNRATSLSRLAEYFVETGQSDLAAYAGQALQRFPTDLSALIALAQVEKARGNTTAYAKTFDTLLASLDGGFDRTLAWDRRVSLAVVLAQGERQDLSRAQVRTCLEKIDETRIRSLTTAALFRLQVLGKAFGLEISNRELRELARKLLPPELRPRV